MFLTMEPSLQPLSELSIKIRNYLSLLWRSGRPQLQCPGRDGLYRGTECPCVTKSRKPRDHALYETYSIGLGPVQAKETSGLTRLLKSPPPTSQ